MRGQQRSCSHWFLLTPSQWCTVLSNPAGVCPSRREYCFQSLRELDSHLRPEASARTLVRYSAPRSSPIHSHFLANRVTAPIARSPSISSQLGALTQPVFSESP